MNNTLFIIGNGFDIQHNIRTEYYAFRDYIIDNKPLYKRENYSTLGERVHADDISDIFLNDAESILKIIDQCAKDDWSDLESALGEHLYGLLLQHISKSPKSNDININSFIQWANIIISGSYNRILFPLKDLFYLWVVNSLKSIDYSSKNKDEKIMNVLKDNALYLSFNYTMTLEEMYGINPNSICHIHGSVNDEFKGVLFGREDYYSVDIDNAVVNRDLKEIKYRLIKDTTKAYLNNSDFFDKLLNIKDIYTYGFSFSDVDMFYINKISEKIDTTKVTWHLNEFDLVKNPNTNKIINKLIKLKYNISTNVEW